VVSADSAGLAGGLAALSDDSATVASLGATARQRYESLYHPTVALRRLVEIYEDLLVSREST
jgi:hypothetical protein